MSPTKKPSKAEAARGHAARLHGAQMAVDAATAEQVRCAHAIDEAHRALNRAKHAAQAAIDARDAIEVEPVIARLPDELRAALAATHYVGGIPSELWPTAGRFKLGKRYAPRDRIGQNHVFFRGSPLGEKVHRVLRAQARAEQQATQDAAAARARNGITTPIEDTTP